MKIEVWIKFHCWGIGRHRVTSDECRLPSDYCGVSSDEFRGYRLRQFCLKILKFLVRKNASSDHLSCQHRVSRATILQLTWDQRICRTTIVQPAYSCWRAGASYSCSGNYTGHTPGNDIATSQVVVFNIWHNMTGNSDWKRNETSAAGWRERKTWELKRKEGYGELIVINNGCWRHKLDIDNPISPIMQGSTSGICRRRPMYIYIYIYMCVCVCVMYIYYRHRSMPLWDVYNDSSAMAMSRSFSAWNGCCLTHDSKVHGANMGPIWGRQDPGGLHVDPMNFVIWGSLFQGSATLLKKYSIAFSVRALFMLIFRSFIVERVDRWVSEGIVTYARMQIKHAFSIRLPRVAICPLYKCQHRICFIDIEMNV